MTEIWVMKVRTGFLLAAALLTSCQDRGTPPKAYVRWQDRLEAATGLPLFGFGGPCYHWHDDKFGGYYGSIPFDQCYKMDPPRRWRGLWRNDFEGSQFCPWPATNCGYVASDKRIGPLYWLSASVPFPEAIKKRRLGGLYAIEFVGRKTTYRGRYGHVGMSDEEIFVDRLISIREVEAPPKPTKDQLEEMKQNCRTIPSCSVPELEKQQME